MIWSENIEQIGKHLRLLSISNNHSEEIPVDQALEILTKMTVNIRDKKQTVFLIGNGASASMASHVAADLAKNAHVHTEVFTDLSLITAIANDMSFEEVYAEPLKRRILRGDMLVAISSSGKSANILRAVQTAKKLGGRVITLSAMRADNPLRGEGELNFYIPAETYGMAETCHSAILHYWIDQIVSVNSIKGHKTK